MAAGAGLVVGDAGGDTLVRVVASCAGEFAGALQVALADEEAHWGKADTQRVFDLRRGGSVLARRGTVAGGASGDASVATDGVGGRVLGLHPVAVLAVDAGAVAGLVAGKAALRVGGGLDDACGLIEICGGLEGVARGEAEFAGGGIPTEAVFYPSIAVLKDGRAGVVAGTEEPGKGDDSFGCTLADGDALGVVSVGGTAALAQSFTGKAFAIVGLEREGVTGF